MNTSILFFTTDLWYNVYYTDPPDINVLLNVENKVVECSPNGIPPDFTFYQWQHRSEYGQLIRSLPDSPMLKLDSTDGNIENYQLNGVYECRAENGISDANGTTVRTGKINVLLKGNYTLKANMLFFSNVSQII